MPVAQFFESLINILFPIACLICNTEGTDLCDHCLISLKPAKPQKNSWITSIWNYRDPNMELLMRHIKKLPNNRLATIFANSYSERILNRPRNPEQWIIIPIPISRTRFFERGYNQSELLAQSISRSFMFPLLTQVLIKKKHTNKQGTASSSEERRQNIVEAFKISHPTLIQGKNIILVDDIVTTGATLSEARKSLLKAGALRVFAWTMAN